MPLVGRTGSARRSPPPRQQPSLIRLGFRSLPGNAPQARDLPIRANQFPSRSPSIPAATQVLEEIRHSRIGWPWHALSEAIPRRSLHCAFPRWTAQGTTARYREIRSHKSSTVNPRCQTARSRCRHPCHRQTDGARTAPSTRDQRAPRSLCALGPGLSLRHYRPPEPGACPRSTSGGYGGDPRAESVLLPGAGAIDGTAATLCRRGNMLPQRRRDESG